MTLWRPPARPARPAPDPAPAAATVWRPPGAGARARRRRRPCRRRLAFIRGRDYLAFLPIHGRGSADRRSGPGRLTPTTKDAARMAKVSPIEFFRQVRAESAKIVWPTRKQTVTTGIMVLIMASILAIFFFGVDNVFQAIVKALLKLVS